MSCSHPRSWLTVDQLLASASTKLCGLQAAEAERALQPEARTTTRADVHAMIDYLRNVGAATKRGDPAEQKTAEAVIRLGRDSARVRGASCMLITRLRLEVPATPSSSADRDVARSGQTPGVVESAELIVFVSSSTT